MNGNSQNTRMELLPSALPDALERLSLSGDEQPMHSVRFYSAMADGVLQANYTAAQVAPQSLDQVMELWRALEGASVRSRV